MTRSLVPISALVRKKGMGNRVFFAKKDYSNRCKLPVIRCECRLVSERGMMVQLLQKNQRRPRSAGVVRSSFLNGRMSPVHSVGPTVLIVLYA
jgi:hypothetical protein